MGKAARLASQAYRQKQQEIAFLEFDSLCISKGALSDERINALAELLKANDKKTNFVLIGPWNNLEEIALKTKTILYRGGDLDFKHIYLCPIIYLSNSYFNKILKETSKIESFHLIVFDGVTKYLTME